MDRRRRFDPGRALQLPRPIRALIGPDLRVISDDVWAKLLWAGLNLKVEDLPAHASMGAWYPPELVRAVARLSTIASQLYNAKDPMSLFELQAWLGHRSPQSTTHYAPITPTKPLQGIHRGRVLRPQRPRDRGPPRPRRHPDRRGRRREPVRGTYDLGHGYRS